MRINFREILTAGGPVLLLLVALSVYSLALIWDRWASYKKTKRGLQSLIPHLRRGISDGNLSELMAACRQNKGPAADVVMASLVGPSHKEDRKRSAERALEREVARLEKGLNVLGTVGGVAPFIGLFGTVLGVMRAFRDLAGAAGAGPGVVAIGISEALVTTAAGLFVAIPAVIGYNYFSARSAEFADELRWLTDEILDLLAQKAGT